MFLLLLLNRFVVCICDIETFVLHYFLLKYSCLNYCHSNLKISTNKEDKHEVLLILQIRFYSRSSKIHTLLTSIQKSIQNISGDIKSLGLNTKSCITFESFVVNLQIQTSSNPCSSPSDIKMTLRLKNESNIQKSKKPLTNLTCSARK